MKTHKIATTLLKRSERGLILLVCLLLTFTLLIQTVILALAFNILVGHKVPTFEAMPAFGHTTYSNTLSKT